MTSWPSVSVLMPVLNRASLVAQAARSVLDQDYAGELELIVIDNGSTDGSADVVRGLGDARIRVVDEERRGIAYGLNRGLALARGELIARNDSDDLWFPQLLSTLVPVLQRRPELGAVYGRAEGVDAAGTQIGEFRGHPLDDPERPLASLLLRDTTCSIAMLYRRSVLEKMGGWRGESHPNEDWDLALRLASRFPLAFEDALVARFLRHPENTTAVNGPDIAPRLQSRRRVLEWALETLPPGAESARLRDLALRNLCIGEGHQWLERGEPLRAAAAYRQSLSHGRPARALARLAWTGALWFGPPGLRSAADGVLRSRGSRALRSVMMGSK